MLVLSRKPGEQIVIDGTIVLTVVEVKGSQVRLALEAPREVPILRGELLQRAAEFAPAVPPAERRG